MNRRDAIRLIGAAAFATISGCSPVLAAPEKVNFLNELRLNTENPIHAGWLADKNAVTRFVQQHRRPFITQLDREIRGTGQGRVVLLWKAFEEITGRPLMPHQQTIGDCVSHGYGLGVDILTCCQIALGKKYERWVAEAATEIIYAGSRQEIGNGKLRGDGSMGVWAADWIRKYGVILRQSYLDGKFDFTTYSGKKARELGARGVGVPDALEPLAKLHPVRTTTLVTSWEECRDAVSNGYPVIMCSNLGFRTTRDRDGFLRRSFRPWYHAMCIIGIDDESTRPGACVMNSWGEHWVSGPTRHGQPAGSFWCDASIIDAGMKQGDSVAISSYDGYPRSVFPDYMMW